MNELKTLAQRLRYAMDVLPPKKIKGVDLARAVGVKPPSVSDWLSGKSKTMEGENLLRTAKFLNINPVWLATGSGDIKPNWLIQNEIQSVPDSTVRYAPVRFVEAKNPNNKNHVRIPIYRDVKASCGDGVENFLEDVSDYLEIDPELLKLMGVRSNSKNLKIIYSAEYSMYPTVAPDSPLFVDVSDKDPNNLKNGNVYVFTHNHELRMKRIFVSYGSNTVKLTSDNPDKNRYPDEFITNEQLNEINFIGRLELALIRP